MLTRISIANFKSYDEATLPLAALTFLVGANAAGKSNLLEALRLLHWLAKGSRLDDIARAIESGDARVRGQSGDLFRDPAQPFTLGLHWSNAPDGWADFEVAVSLLADQLVITGEQVTQPSEKVPLYTLDGPPSPH
ncbi:MAG: AAA family ATPase, partial [Lamprobacter sp.]|uniref:AAA family ATPase n=1 Tax=Lamprobacter sp. TaxID=3100796 RepID=UPI002B2614F1